MCLRWGCKQNFLCSGGCEEGGNFVIIIASTSPAGSNLPAIFFGASKAPEMTASSHMGFSLCPQVAEPSSGFRVSISLHFEGLLPPKFFVYANLSSLFHRCVCSAEPS